MYMIKELKKKSTVKVVIIVKVKIETFIIYDQTYKNKFIILLQ